MLYRLVKPVCPLCVRIAHVQVHAAAVARIYAMVMWCQLDSFLGDMCELPLGGLAVRMSYVLLSNAAEHEISRPLSNLM